MGSLDGYARTAPPFIQDLVNKEIAKSNGSRPAGLEAFKHNRMFNKSIRGSNWSSKVNSK